jgi:glutathione synthase
MRFAFLVNDVATEQPDYATTRLAMTAIARGHAVWYIDVDGFAYDPDEKLRARAYAAPSRRHRKPDAFLEAVRAGDGGSERIDLAELDVLLLRNDPAQDFGERPWAQGVGIIFGEQAARRGVIVLNDPSGLSKAFNKLYFQHFPPEVRPETLVSRDADEVRHFVADHRGHAVLKPLQGSGGQAVFLVRPDDAPNLNQMIEAVSRDGYIVAQEYLPAAAEGDVRLLLLNGRPLEVDGRYAAFRRVNKTQDLRSNMHVGGEAVEVKVDAGMLDLADRVRPKLLQDGMFLVGLDIVGDKLMEANVFSPGGLTSAGRLQERDFTTTVVEAIERKVYYRDRYAGRFSNTELATM